jgi:hypothetical protein
MLDLRPPDKGRPGMTTPQKKFTITAFKAQLSADA